MKITNKMVVAFHSKATITKEGSILNFEEAFNAALSAADAEPAGYQWRWRAIGKEVGEWQPWEGGRAPKLATSSYEVEERIVYTAPPAVAVKALAPVDVYKALKRWDDEGQLDVDYLAQISCEIAALVSPDDTSPRPIQQDVIDLVIAAREAFDTSTLPDEENRALDKALEAFSSRVPYENQPDYGDQDACIVCGEHLEKGDMVYWSVNDDGHMHANCTTSYVDDDGKETTVPPEPFAFRPSSAPEIASNISPFPAIWHVRHRKRGSTYWVHGYGRLQAEVPAADMTEVVVYRSEDDGSIWVRPVGEFQDGRFQVLLPKGDGE